MKKCITLFSLFMSMTQLSCNSVTEQQKQEPAAGFIKAGNYQVYYERTGKGDAVIFLHAGLLDHTMWDEQVKALSSQYEVITIDEPYHGKTTGNDTTLLAQEIIKTVLDSLHIQKASVVGLSMGTGPAQDFMVAYPGRVNKIILISGGVNGFEKEHPVDSVSAQWFVGFKKAMDNKDTPAAAAEFARAWAEGIYRSSDSLRSPASQFVYKKSLENIRLHKMEGWPVTNEHPPAIKKLSTVHVPVLIIDGDKDLPYIITNCAYMEKNIPGAKRVTIKDVAHMLNLEKPAEVNKLIMDFLKEP